MDGGFFGAGGPAVDADVAGDEIGLAVWMGALVLGDEPTRGIRAVVEQKPVEVLIGFLVVVAVFGQVIIERRSGVSGSSSASS